MSLSSGSSPYADLHTHTQYSDGELSPTTLVKTAAEQGLRALAVTDHDTLEGVSRAQEAARGHGLVLISGTELSVTLEGIELHLLAYGMDPAHTGLENHIRAMRQARWDRAEQMVERLRAHGLTITEEHLHLQTEETSAVGRPHVAAALVAAGHVQTTREAFEKYLGQEGPGYVPKPEVAAEDVLALVHEAGGVGVLAHPGDWVSSTQIRQLVERGLDGIEVTHPSHRASLRDYYRRLASGHDLLTTGGSDYHGETDDAHFGDIGMEKDEWERFRAAVA